MPWTIEIVIPLPSNDLPDAEQLAGADAIERLFMDAFHRQQGVEYQGNAHGGGSLVLYYESVRPRSFLKSCRSLTLLHNIEGATVRAQNIADDQRAGESFTLDDYEKLLPVLNATAVKRSRNPKIGDYYALPLSDGRWGHALYVTHEAPWGDFIQVLDIIRDSPSNIETLIAASALFPPVGTYVARSAKIGRWKYLGNCPTTPVPIMPPMRTSPRMQCEKRPGQYQDWIVSSSTEWRAVGALPEELRALEVKVPWTAEQIAHRIMTGINIYSVYY